MKKPILSIITATYNSGETIRDTIESVLSQSFNDYEYIIIDGKSSDKTVDIIQSYEPLFGHRLKWISEPDCGIYDAWNKGVNMSSGEWICFIGSDDIFLPNALDLYFQRIRTSQNLNFVSSRIELINANKQVLKAIGLPWSSKMKRYCSIAHVGSWHKRSLFDLNGFYSLKYKICSDYEFLLRNFDYINASFIENVTVQMRIGGVSNLQVSRVLKETLRIKNDLRVNNPIFNYLFYLLSILSSLVSTKN